MKPMHMLLTILAVGCLCSCISTPYQRLFVFEAYPTVNIVHEYRGSIVGPMGELMDGDKIEIVLDLNAEGKTIRIQDPPIMSIPELEAQRLYRFTLFRSEKRYLILEIHDGDKLIYPKEED